MAKSVRGDGVIFFIEEKESFIIKGWDEYNQEDDVTLGVISKFNDGYYYLRFMSVPLCCGAVKRIAAKISELNQND